VSSLAVHCRDPSTLNTMTPHWRNSLRSVKLVRWHQRPPGLDNGADLEPLLRNCPALRALDLSEFYCSTEDILPALAALTELDLGLAGDRTLAGGSGTPASAGPRVATAPSASRALPRGAGGTPAQRGAATARR
jgi:hypothetical protein